MVNAGLCAVVPGNGSTLSEHSEEPDSLDMVIQGNHSCLIRGWHYLVLGPFIKITDNPSDTMLDTSCDEITTS